MRNDMDKLLCERPRRHECCGGNKGYRSFVQTHGLEAEGRRGKLKGLWRGGSKHLNENLAPLKRYLRANVGRPWDKVFAEMSRHIRADSAVQLHILQHLWQFVERHVEIDGEIVRHRTNTWCGRNELHDRTLYVCPRTGLLREYRRRRAAPSPRRPTITELWLSDSVKAVWIKGEWIAREHRMTAGKARPRFDPRKDRIVWVTPRKDRIPVLDRPLGERERKLLDAKLTATR
jgi:hypothetical protein